MNDTGNTRVNRVNIQIPKNRFVKKFPSSSILQIILSMPDVVEGEELIGAVGVWLNILDIERAKYIGRGK